MKERIYYIKHSSEVKSTKPEDMSVFVLDKNVVVGETDIARVLNDDEKKESESRKHPLRRFEYNRSRWLIRNLTTIPEIVSNRVAKTVPEIVPNSDDGVPQFPYAIIGSISHKNGHVVIALSGSGVCSSMGVDLESVVRMKEELEQAICSAQESKLLDIVCNEDKAKRLFFLSVVFSFKEALFKAVYPHIKERFYFHDASIFSIDQEAQEISAKLNFEVPKFLQAVLVGRYNKIELSDGIYVLSTISLPVF